MKGEKKEKKSLKNLSCGEMRNVLYREPMPHSMEANKTNSEYMQILYTGQISGSWINPE